MTYLVIALAVIPIFILMHIGMKQGYSAWAEKEANRRSQEMYKRYIDSTKFVINPKITIEYTDETKG